MVTNYPYFDFAYIADETGNTARAGAGRFVQPLESDLLNYPSKRKEKGFATFLGRKREKPSAIIAPSDQQTQLLKTANVNERFSAEEAQQMAEPHAPECMLICCIDSRFQPAKALDYGPGTTLEHRPIACVVPPAYKADPDLMSRMAFRRLKEISNIILVCHSDCGGAQAALEVPNPDPNSDDDLHTVASVVHRSGLDIPLLGKGFLAQTGGDKRKAGDLLAREVGVKSLHNLMGYKGSTGYATISDEVSVGALTVMLFYFDLEKRALEMYDVQKGAWSYTPECERFGLKSKEVLHAPAQAGIRPAVSLKKAYEK